MSCLVTCCRSTYHKAATGGRARGAATGGRGPLLYSGWIVVASLVAFSAAIEPAAGADAPSTDRRFLAGLRERGLYELAEKHCTKRLADPALTETERAELTAELARALAEQAASSPPDERGPLWERAGRVTEQFIEQNPQSSRLLLVRLQAALTLLDRGELARQEAELLGGDPARFEAAKAHLRAAVGRLKTLDQEVEEQIRRGPAPRPSEGDPLSPDQLQSLRNTIQYQLARAYRNQAMSYPAQSPDRANSLVKATRLLEFLAKLPTADPLSYRSAIALVRCTRLLGEHEKAQRYIELLLRDEVPPAMRLSARAEAIELLLATDRLDQALKVASQPRAPGDPASPELDYAALEAFLAAWHAAVEAKDDDNTRAWQDRATRQVQTIESLHGPYWGRRAELRLAGYVRGAPVDANLDMLVRAAESAYRSGNLDEALAAYDRAQAAARQQGAADRAFELGYTAAAVEHQRGHHNRSLGRFRHLAKSNVQHAKAPQAHLLAVHHAAQLAREESPGALDLYVTLLREHLDTWPRGPTADEARRRLARLREHQRDWQGAIAAYTAISPAAEDYEEAVGGAARCYRAWLDQRKAAGQPTEAVAGEAAAWFESLVADAQGRPPERWSPLQRRAALEAARLRLGYTQSSYARAEGVLAAALGGAADAPDDWKSDARALLILSLAGQGKRTEAAEMLDQISSGPPEALLTMLDGLGRIAAEAPPDVRRELAELQLRTMGLLERGEQAPSALQRRALERLRARALADAGRTAEARAAYRALADAFPRDGEIQEAYAELLSAGEDRASLEGALERWRELERKSPARSPRWFRAKYSLAFLHYRLGSAEQAAKIITLLKVLHPDLGGPEMQAKFEDLLARCQP